MNYRKKLIEVALPLEAINRASAREKSIRHGHPSTLHLWWARRPLATCRAVLFASLVDDPSSWPEIFKTEDAQQKERQRLFDLIEELVIWENSNNETILRAAQIEIARSVARNLGDRMPDGAMEIKQYLAEKTPPVLDPFCGGGSIPLEAQRLGLRAHASDLNPVAVLITKALIEIPPKFANMLPVNPESRNAKLKTWKGAAGLAEDVRYYGEWMRNEAEKRIGRFYPKIKLPKEYGAGEATVIAWLWARTVKCPNPACGSQMPLVRSFALSTKKGKEVHVEPVVKGNKYHFEVMKGKRAPEGTILRAKGGKCVCCGSSASLQYLRDEGNGARIGARLLAIVAEGEHGRIYLAPNNEHEAVANSPEPNWKPEIEMPNNARWFSPPGYGFKKFGDLFTQRQLLALTTFSELVREAHEHFLTDARGAGMYNGTNGIESGESGVTSYADAIATFLSMGVDKLADRNSTISSWDSGYTKIRNTFGRQAIPMTWDFAEANPFSESTGNWLDTLEWGAKGLESWSGGLAGKVTQLDATESLQESNEKIIISTDPPYYDNIGYADLSDFFYAWLRPTLRGIYPQLFATVQVPKKKELIATPYRFGGDREAARDFFEQGLGRSFGRMRDAQHSDYPLAVYYAFKQSETEEDEDDSTASLVSTGWETMLEGLLKADFSIHGTWPMRSELSNRMIASGTNALASSIVLVCRPRSNATNIATRRELLNALRSELPNALRDLQRGNIAPVDLAQASIGPGMSIFSRYSKVVESDGMPMKVRTALGLINQVLDELLAEQEDEFDPDTRWAVAWFEQNGINEGKYGDAETLSKAKNVSVNGLQESGILKAKGGKVKLLCRDDMPEDWDPQADRRLSVWEIAQHLILRLESDGEQAAAELLRKVGALGETARDLAYRLYAICERKKWAQEALAYNGLVIAWPEISKLAREPRTQQRTQVTLE